MQTLGVVTTTSWELLQLRDLQTKPTFGSDVLTRQLVKRVAHNDVSLQAAYKTDHKVTATVKGRLQQTPTAKVTTGRDCAAAHPDISQATRSARLVLKEHICAGLVIRLQFKEGE